MSSSTGQAQLNAQEARRLSEVLERLHEDVYGTDPNHPGVMLRMDRLERRFDSVMKLLKFCFGGGLAAALGTLATLVAILNSLSNIGGA